ncbi:MAG: TIGR02466 family protein [Caulobacteraceae bacterium]
MADVRKLFATSLYQVSFADEPGFSDLTTDLVATARMMAAEDRAGRLWSRANRFGGYTSYATPGDLARKATAFGRLKRRLDRHVAAFAEELAFDLGPRGRLTLDGLWVNILRRGARHEGHIHPLSVISGTYYVAAPPGSGALRLEDPRLSQMMAAPPLRSDAPEGDQRSISVIPRTGDLLLWESWLRHEVMPGGAERISLSFNYAWR